MARKIKDIAVKTGVYTDNMGIEKGRYENVGVMMQGDDGNHFIILNRTFNPAGVPVAPGKDTVILSLFDPKTEQSTPVNAAQGQALPANHYQQSQAFQHPNQAPQGQYTNPNGSPMTPQQVQAARAQQNGAPY